jgi:N4-gp56 family major capsid protein
MSVINKLAVVQANNISQAEFWEKRLLRMIVLEQSNFVFSNLGVEKDIPANEGTKIFSMRRNNHLPVGDHKLTEGVAPTALKVEGQKVQGTVNALINITNWVDDIHMGDVFREYQPELARHAAEVKERDILAAFTDASEYFCGIANVAKIDMASTDVLTLKDVRLVWLTMKNFRRKGHSKYGGKPVCIVHPNVMQDLLDDDTLEHKLLVPGQENQVIKIGTLDNYVAYGVVFQETLIAEVETVQMGAGSSPETLNVYTSYVLGEDPYIVLKLKTLKWFSKGFTADSGDPLGQNAHMGYRFWTGAKIIDPIAITKIYSCSAYDVALADFTSDDLGRAASQV